MKNLIAIVAGEPNSINSEIIAKVYNQKKQKKIFIIGNHLILKKQIIKLGFKIPVIKIDKLDDIKKEKKIFVLDVPLKFNSIFNVSSSEVKTYVFKSFNIAHKLAINT